MDGVIDPAASEYYAWRYSGSGELKPGTGQFRDAFCALLLETFNPYKPAIIEWPVLQPDELARLTALPFWDTAVAIEGRASLRMRAHAEALKDRLIGKALALNADEESRHKVVLHNMLEFYRIQLGQEPVYRAPTDTEFGFLRTGFGECINSFFAFGLFDLARSSRFFPPPLVEAFEPIIQEEARHIMFFANYVAHRRATLRGVRYLAFQAKCAIAVAEQFLSRLSMAVKARSSRKKVKSNFLTKGVSAVAAPTSPLDFFALCLRENDRRMGGYEPRLLRPMMMPSLVTLFLKLRGRTPQETAAA